MTSEAKIGTPNLPREKVEEIDWFVSQRLSALGCSDTGRRALERFVSVRIRYWVSRKGYAEVRVSLWDVEEAKASLLKAMRRRRSDVEALEQKLTNLLRETEL